MMRLYKKYEIHVISSVDMYIESAIFPILLISTNLGKMAFLGYPCTEGDKEAMLKRKIENYLQEHYSTDEKALLITGARQTGKTFSIREFGKTFKRSPDYNLPEAFIFCNDNIGTASKKSRE